MSKELLTELNTFRATEGKEPFADWRKARHMPMLEAYRINYAVAIDSVSLSDNFEMSEGERANQVGRESADIARDEAMFETKIVGATPDMEPGVCTAQVDTVKVDEKGKVTVTAKVIKPTEDKIPSYKTMPRHVKSTVEKPFNLVHSFLDANPTLTRKQAVAALVEQGVNFYTARTQYQRWFSKNKKD